MMMTTLLAMIEMTLGSKQWEYRTQVRHGSDPNTMAGLGGGSALWFNNIQPSVENFTYHRMDLFDKITTPLLKLESYRPEYRNYQVTTSDLE